MERTRVAIVADDLIWASRLAAAVERAGAQAVRPGRSGELSGPFGGAIVDLGARSFDGLTAVGSWRSAGVPVIAVAQHDDVALRKQALASGAARVYSYNKLFADGPAVIAAWLAGLGRGVRAEGRQGGPS
ncbi:MAG: hypothetical protein ACXVAE_05790 [Candidatus Limnocylindrales bacterium]